MSAQVQSSALWEAWDKHCETCTQCAAQRMKPVLERSAEGLCMEGNMLNTKWLASLEVALHQDEADSDRGRE